jgi:xylose isomerase
MGDMLMGFELNLSIITASLGNLGDRFLSSGYKENIGLEEKLRKISLIEELTGVELCYDPDGEESDAGKVKNLLKTYNLEASVVNAPLSSRERWKFGTFSAMDGKIRKEAIELTKETINFAEGVGASMVNLWQGQDGFDYCFQVDYGKQWEHMIEGIRECADYKPHMMVSLEFKPREPRNRALLNTASTTLLMIQETDRKNVGVTVDNGHVLQHGENMAQVVELCARYGKLFNLHLNDNYAAWDDDMIVGSVHLVEYLELLYVLRKIGYTGWSSIDIFPFREDAFRATEESVKYMVAYNVVDLHSSEPDVFVVGDILAN